MSVRDLWQRVNRKRRLLGIAGLMLAGLVAVLVGRAPKEVQTEQVMLVRVEKGVKVLPVKGQLKPTTTFEVRFEQPVISRSEVQGKGPSPLVFQPDIPGTFQWTSTRSGVFSPSKGFELATTYVASLKPELKDVSGRQVRAK